jgi:hypothetical protein
MSQSIAHQPALKLSSTSITYPSSTNRNDRPARYDSSSAHALHTASPLSEGIKERSLTPSRDHTERSKVEGSAEGLKFGRYYYPWEGLDGNPDVHSLSPSLSSDEYTEGPQGWNDVSDAGISEICHPDVYQCRSVLQWEKEQEQEQEGRVAMSKRSVKSIIGGRVDDWALAVDPKSHKWYYYNRYVTIRLLDPLKLSSLIHPYPKASHC